MTDRFLPTSLRRALERDIKEARRVAEEGAADAIRRLGVADPEAPAHLSDEDKAARRRLRAHARALGDTIVDGVHTIDHLIEAAAYAQWHRRLFARFLAERGLLRHPNHGVAVTLDEAEELATEEGFVDGWSAAEAYAARMLPAVFQPEDPVLALTFAPEHAQALRKLVLGIDGATFRADDALGWTYQFWRALEKERINQAGGKIGARELPAVTQLFTEPYMVKFLLHNTLGAWRAGRVLASRPELATNAEDEAALRIAVSPPGYEFDMLRFVREGEDGPWRPAAEAFQGWPTTSAEIRALDPCCGSGHFLTEMLAILAALRADEEGLSDAHAVAAVLSDNLFGLELDGRCVQIAAFAVALTAWRIGGFQPFGTDQVHIAWVGAPPPLERTEFEALGNGDDELRYALGHLYDLFLQAPVLGSLLEPTGGDLLGPKVLGKLETSLPALLERARSAEPERSEGAIAAKGMADAARLLSRRFHLVVTNPPFLTEIKYSEPLEQYLKSSMPNARRNLSTAIMERMFRIAVDGGAVCSVAPQSWLQLKRYSEFRNTFQSARSLRVVVKLGQGAFLHPNSNGEAVCLTIAANEKSQGLGEHVLLDAAVSVGPLEKSQTATTTRIENCVGFLEVRVDEAIGTLKRVGSMQEMAESRRGISTSDSQRFIGKFWEHADSGSDWSFLQSTSGITCLFSGKTDVVFWEREAGQLAFLANQLKHLNHDVQNWRRGKPLWGKAGVVVSQMAPFNASIYSGDIYDSNCCAIVPTSAENEALLWAFVSSEEFRSSVFTRNGNRKVEVGTFLATPVDLEKWRKVAERDYPSGLPEPFSDDPTQWLFHGHPAQAETGTQLHVALGRLAGYRWPAETDPNMRLSANSRDWVAKAAVLPAPDADGILPLAAVGSERPLADRLRDYLNVAIPGWDEARLVREADERIDKKMGKDLSLDGWLRDRAFRQHSALFHNRPFLWQVWDGQKDGFSAFLHYHRLDHAALQKLTYTLLGAWITRREAEKDERRVEAAKVLKQELEAILEGEAPQDIFVRWKPLAQQPLGWNPDLDDGVRLNIRPWVTAGVLREPAPKGIKWGVDRGKDVASAPWFKLDKGERNNDRHTTLAEKQAARDAAAAKVAKA